MVADGRIKSKQDLLRSLKAALAPDVYNDIKSITDAGKAAERIESEVELRGLSKSDVRDLWTKKVTISVEADAGEEVEVVAPEAAPAETEAMDPEDEAEGEKARKPVRKQRPAMDAKAWDIARVGFSVGSGVKAKKAAYARAVADGADWRGKRAPIADPDMAEAFASWGRKTIMGDLDYSEKANDLSIISNIKDLTTAQNMLGGATVPVVFQRELIANRARYGAAQRAIGVTTMEIGQNMLPRLIDDVDVSVIGEGAADTDQSKPEFDNVEMRTRDVRGLIKISNSLINDSAIDIVSEIGDSFDRGFGKFEDINFLLSRSASGASNSFEGILDKVGTDSTSDAALSTGWADYTIAKVQAVLEKLSDRAWDSSARIGWICSRPFFDSVLERFALSAGGNTGDGIYRGYRTGGIDGADASWNGYPVWFTPSMPRSYSADQIVALFGAFDAACKIGEVLGAERLMTSEQRYFENNQIGIRAVRRLAFNAHDVNNVSDPDTGSMVVALQD